MTNIANLFGTCFAHKPKNDSFTKSNSAPLCHSLRKPNLNTEILNILEGGGHFGQDVGVFYDERDGVGMLKYVGKLLGARLKSPKKTSIKTHMNAPCLQQSPSNSLTIYQITSQITKMLIMGIYCIEAYLGPADSISCATCHNSLVHDHPPENEFLVYDE
jgi:hypothetical protein